RSSGGAAFAARRQPRQHHLPPGCGQRSPRRGRADSTGDAYRCVDGADRGGGDMSGSEEGQSHELVIIRRRSHGDEGGHHGGVWKIAYADFMTAMMAFFLVMWLINSTDKRVLTQVANYFNPMRLTDSTPHSRGLNSVESGEQGKQGKQTSVGDPKDMHKGKEKAQDKSEANPPAPKSDAKEDASTTNTARYTEQAH